MELVNLVYVPCESGYHYHLTLNKPDKSCEIRIRDIARGLCGKDTWFAKDDMRKRDISDFAGVCPECVAVMVDEKHALSPELKKHWVCLLLEVPFGDEFYYYI